jgi:hypothetical protein
MKIFQAYYKEEQRSQLDTEFYPFDNTSNPVINLHEHHIYTKIYEQAVKNNEDFWGHFSWQWKTKLKNFSAAQILDIINSNPNFDVYIFNTVPDEAADFWNVWEHGQFCHPKILTLTERILLEMGEDVAIMQTPMGTNTYIMANYFVGNKIFWDVLLEFLGKFINALDRLPDEYAAMLNESAEYPPNLNLDYRGFICERMISTYLTLNQNSLRIRPLLESYNYIAPDQKSSLFLKDQAIETHNRELLRSYINSRRAFRNSNWHNWGRDWVNTCVL